MRHKKDPEHINYATSQNAVILTNNCDEFRQYHKSGKYKHSGMFLLYKYNNPKKDMTMSEIARAIQNIINSGLQLVNELYTLNEWK